MSESDYNEEFNSIVNSINLEDYKDPRHDFLTVWEINRAITGMNEAATMLGRYLMQCITDEEQTEIPAKVTPMVRELIELNDSVSEILSQCNCPECAAADCEYCTVEEYCQACLEELMEDEEDD